MKHILNRFSIALATFCAVGLIAPIGALAAGPLPVDLLSATNFAIVSKTGITNTGSHTTVITGNIGSSPITAAAMNNVFCSEISGTIYGVDAAYVGSGDQTCFAGNPPLANKTSIDNAILDMGVAYTDAAGRTLPTSTNLGAGDIGGLTITPGLYKWTTGVTIPTSVTLSGGASDVWIFQIAGDLDIASAGSVISGVKVILSGGAVAENVFWQVGGLTGATLGTYSTFNGTILAAKQIIIQTGAVLNGRALAQTQVTLDANVISAPTVATPATLNVIKVVVNGNGGVAVPSTFNLHVKNLGVEVSGSPAAGVSSPGTAYSVPAGTYVVSEDANAGYTQIIGGDCNVSGSVSLFGGDNKTCTIINTDVAPPPAPAPVVSTLSGGSFAPLPLINITKIPTPLALPNGPGPVTYDYTLTNLGVVAMQGIWVKDTECAAVVYISGDTNSDAYLDISETWKYSCTKTVTKTETNAATAHGQANGWEGYDTANATVVVGAPSTPPLIHLVTRPSVFVLPAQGGDVIYSYTVTNPGKEPLHDVRIVDDKCTGLPSRVTGHPGDLNKNDLLESNETWSFTCTTKLTRSTTNNAFAEGKANGLTAVDFSPVTVLVGAPALPNTGFESLAGCTTSWNTLIPIAVIVAVLLILIAKKKGAI